MLVTIVRSEPLVWLFSLAWDAVILALDVGASALAWSLTLPIETPEVAPGRMIDNFLPIPDAESLPLCRMVLKLA